LVDDETMLGSSLTRLWRRRFEVLYVDGVEAALAVLDEVDVVLCDLKMPYRGGIEFYAEVRDRRPDLLHKVVFMTGDLCCEDTRDFLEGIENARYEKPFDTRAVADRLVSLAS